MAEAGRSMPTRVHHLVVLNDNLALSGLTIITIIIILIIVVIVIVIVVIVLVVVIVVVVVVVASVCATCTRSLVQFDPGAESAQGIALLEVLLQPLQQQSVAPRCLCGGLCRVGCLLPLRRTIDRHFAVVGLEQRRRTAANATAVATHAAAVVVVVAAAAVVAILGARVIHSAVDVDSTSADDTACCSRRSTAATAATAAAHSSLPCRRGRLLVLQLEELIGVQAPMSRLGVLATPQRKRRLADGQQRRRRTLHKQNIHASYCQLANKTKATTKREA